MLDKMPKKIANFEIIRELGRGGMGCVYLAKQMKHSSNSASETLRLVALKILPMKLPQSSTEQQEYTEARERFDAEIRAVSMLESDNIVRLYDSGFADNVQYLAMQFVDGTSLFDIIQRYKKTMPIDKIVAYTRQICRGLMLAHSKGVIHRDIKPQNILVSRETDKCHISDFGIAKIKREGRLTMVGMAVGTPEYMSPEQASGKNLDQQTDIYSLGTLIYEMCTGNPPFHGSDPVSVAYQQVHEEPKKPSKIRHDIPVRLENIIMKCLKKNKFERYHSIGDILKDIDMLEKEENSSVSYNIPELPKLYSPVKTPSFTEQRREVIKRYRSNQIQNEITDKITHSIEIMQEKNHLMPVIVLLLAMLGVAELVIILLLVLRNTN